MTVPKTPSPPRIGRHRQSPYQQNNHHPAFYQQLNTPGKKLTCGLVVASILLGSYLGISHLSERRVLSSSLRGSGLEQEVAVTPNLVANQTHDQTNEVKPITENKGTEVVKAPEEQQTLVEDAASERRASEAVPVKGAEPEDDDEEESNLSVKSSDGMLPPAYRTLDFQNQCTQFKSRAFAKSSWKPKIDIETQQSYCSGGYDKISQGSGSLHTVGPLITVLSKAQHDDGIFGSVGEVGVHHGRFTGFLFVNSRETEDWVVGDLFEELQDQNVDNSGLGDKKRFLKGMRVYGKGEEDLHTLFTGSTDVLPLNWSDERGFAPFRLMSVDAGHTAELTYNDLALAFCNLLEGGIIVLDDWFSNTWPGVVEGYFQYINVATQTELGVAEHQRRRLEEQQDSDDEDDDQNASPRPEEEESSADQEREVELLEGTEEEQDEDEGDKSDSAEDDPEVGEPYESVDDQSDADSDETTDQEEEEKEAEAAKDSASNSVSELSDTAADRASVFPFLVCESKLFVTNDRQAHARYIQALQNAEDLQPILTPIARTSGRGSVLLEMHGIKYLACQNRGHGDTTRILDRKEIQKRWAALVY